VPQFPVDVIPEFLFAQRQSDLWPMKETKKSAFVSRLGTAPVSSTTKFRLANARRGMAWPGEARHGRAGQCWARRGEARHHNHSGWSVPGGTCVSVAFAFGLRVTPSALCPVKMSGP